MNYAFASQHSIGFKYSYTYSPKRQINGVYDARIFEDALSFEQIKSNSHTDGDSKRHSINLYYNGTIKKWNIDFNTDLLWMDTDTKNDILEEENPNSENANVQTVNTLYKIQNNLYASKLLFSRPILGGDFAFGGEFSHTNRNTDYKNMQGILQNDASEIKENNAGAFAEFARKYGGVQLQVGFRYEYVMFDYYQEGIRQEEQSKKYNHLFPSVSIGGNIGKIQMRLGYTQDISRPGFHSLRSNILYVNHYTYETGNPLLSPVIVHNASLTSTYKWWQLYASYQRIVDNVMFSIEPYTKDNPNIVLIKPINVKSYSAAHMRLSATPVIAWWSPRFTLAVQKQRFEAETHEGKINMDRPQLSFRWQNSLKLPAGFLFSLNGNWISKHDRGNSSVNKASWSIDGSLYKEFMGDRLSLQLNGYDLFLTRRSDRTDFSGEYYTFSKTITPNTRSVTLSIRYKFNQVKNK